MAAPKGILALTGIRPPDEDEGADEGESEGGDSPKARAMREMFEAMEGGDWDAAGRAFERAYMICKQGKSSGESPAEESEEESDEYEG
ncbi:MAG TPA: hypothetical protein VFZ53_14270 [Polyangiaceae bacterium]